MAERKLEPHAKGKSANELLELPFDQYQRYRDVKEVVDRLRAGSRQLRILDVGGGEGQYLPAPDFFPSDDVVVADLHDFELHHYIRASGLNLPFKSDSFDVAFSCDTLEHVPAKDREQFVSELFRVSRRFIVLIAPFQSPINELAEHLVQEIYSKELGQPNQALLEHAECGLPEFDAIQQIIQKLSSAFLSFPSGQIENWLIMNSIVFTAASLGEEIYRAANHIYNQQLYQDDHSRPAYRTCFVAVKTKNDHESLKRLQVALSPWFEPAKPQRGGVSREGIGSFSNFRHWLRALTALKKIIADKDNHIRNIEAALADLQRAVVDKDNHIRNIEASLNSLQRTTEERDRKLQEKESALNAMQNSLDALLAELEEEKGKNEIATRTLESRIEALDDQAKEQSARAEKAERQVNVLSGSLVVTEQILKDERSELERIQKSASWQFVRRFWMWNMRLFPFGSRRRNFYRNTVGRIARSLLGIRTPEKPVAQSPSAGVAPAAPSPQAPEVPAAKKPDIRMNCDNPKPGETCGRLYLIRGWALAGIGVQKVEVQVDDKLEGEANYGQARPDVGADHANYPNSNFSGFFYVWNSSKVSEGPHEITIVVESKTGERESCNVPITVNHSLANRAYDRWITVNEPSTAQLVVMRDEVERFAYRPVVSIVTPVYRTPMNILQAAIDSVRNQVYENWQLCLADDGSADPEITRLLRDFSAQDSRITFTELSSNQGIAAATNAAISLASGEFVGFLDHDDELAPDALYWVVKLLQNNRDADLIYSDEDKLDLAGNRFEPFFKPDWSPDLLLSSNYICHFLVAKRQLVLDVGGLRSEYDGSQDYDLALRLTAQTKRIQHIPRVSYHWRAVQTSTAYSPEVKSKAHLAAERAISDFLARNRIRAHVEQGCDVGRWQVRYEILENPKVAVIMPTGGRLELLRPCLESFFSNTDYPNYEILLVDNSKGQDVKQYAASLAIRNGDLHYIDYRGKKFNFSSLNNFAVSKTTAPLLLFLNDDTTMVNRDWLTAMVEQGQRPSVGAVGAKLLYPWGVIQHAGVVMGLYDNTSHAFKNIPDNTPHYYFDFPNIIRNCSAVTAACMLTRSAVFLEMGGLDEKNLAVAFQDVDYCLKLCKAGYYVVYTPLAVLIHHESVTKTEKMPNMREVRFMQRKWADVITHDPFYSPNLTRNAEDYSLHLE